jgi:hypothetical protein
LTIFAGSVFQKELKSLARRQKPPSAGPTPLRGRKFVSNGAEVRVFARRPQLYEAERQAEWAEKWKMTLLTAGAGVKSTPDGANAYIYVLGVIPDLNLTLLARIEAWVY